jgi:hypothetical protein
MKTFNNRYVFFIGIFVLPMQYQGTSCVTTVSGESGLPGLMALTNAAIPLLYCIICTIVCLYVKHGVFKAGLGGGA